ncbi:DUF86 domain-containing protein [Pseudomonas mediterranea]|uniref:type VII toxin-antitoxin system HepT family RNase toxin n=1 Tax=Pseudomonas mediterranea TaxID=183795 RepID=UPI0009DD0949|nr:HepT-like ribonuclease domain-containing protein [Pseudomonas mediterranea]MBL0842658.1 DUF86 domain-containing protein [Pseudomonas mediterranea]QHA85033.1 DUF86 domain-containing protein [Pseudomonas mediterranea]UZE00766.1 DUF86 domain-containing protein [Pseudomonas mediterranea]
MFCIHIAEIIAAISGRTAVFELLFQGGWVAESLVKHLKNMVGFRNIAVHDYQALQLPIMVAIITRHLDDFLEFSAFILRKDSTRSAT